MLFSRKSFICFSGKNREKYIYSIFLAVKVKFHFEPVNLNSASGHVGSDSWTSELRVLVVCGPSLLGENFIFSEISQEAILAFDSEENRKGFRSLRTEQTVNGLLRE